MRENEFMEHLSGNYDLDEINDPDFLSTRKEDPSYEKHGEGKVWEWIREQISDLTDGTMRGELFPTGYDDRVSAGTIMKAYWEYLNTHSTESSAFREEFPDGTFSDYLKEKIGELLLDSGTIDDKNELYAEEIEERLSLMDEEFREDYRRTTAGLADYRILAEAGFEGFNIAFEEFLDDDYKFNFMFATKEELNQDMGSIPGLWDCDPDYCPLLCEDDTDNALTYLIRQQGYTLTDAIKEKSSEEIAPGESGNSFLRSLKDEVWNFPGYSMAELTACFTLSGKDLLNVLDAAASGKGYISISKDASFGIYNEWQGTGSDFCIEPEKDVVFPASMICNIQMEDAGKSNNVGYTVNDVYGFISSIWTDGSASVTKEAPVLKEERFEDVKAALIERGERETEESELE